MNESNQIRKVLLELLYRLDEKNPNVFHKRELLKEELNLSDKQLDPNVLYFKGCGYIDITEVCGINFYSAKITFLGKRLVENEQEFHDEFPEMDVIHSNKSENNKIRKDILIYLNTFYEERPNQYIVCKTIKEELNIEDDKFEFNISYLEGNGDIETMPTAAFTYLKIRPQGKKRLEKKIGKEFENEKTTNLNSNGKVDQRPIPQIKKVSSRDIDGIYNVQVLLITAVRTEKNAVLRYLSPFDKNYVISVNIKGETYYIGRYGAYNAVLTMCGTGSINRDSVILATKNAIDYWKPKAIIMIGIAFGSDSKKQKIGDVLVSDQIINYETQRISNGNKIIYRGLQPEVGKVLLNRFRNVIDWDYSHPNGQRSTIIFGAILSGEKLIDDMDFKKILLERYPNSIGGDMEGIGLYAVAASTPTM